MIENSKTDAPLPRIRLAMLGMVDGNGHPYSWSAIINGRYDADLMRDCGFPVIPQYLGTQAPDALGIEGAKVTHVWCEDANRAKHIAAACFIEHVLADPRAAIGQADAVIIPTDIGEEHLERARPFIESDLPVFIDKPLTTDPEHLKQFIQWRREGRRIFSTSAMRYAKEFTDLRPRLNEIGDVRFITAMTPKSWERYGIHAIEMIYGLLDPGGWLWAADAGDDQSSVVHLRHKSGVDAVIAAIDDLYGCFGHVQIYGTKGNLSAKFSDTFSAFKAQLVAFVDVVRTGASPFDFAQTAEQMKMLIAGTRSRREGGRRVPLSEI